MKLLKIMLGGFFLLCPLFSFPDTIKVPLHYSTIQEAINNAQNGDTILVADGLYTGEGNVELSLGSKEIFLISENGAENCIIDGESTEYFAFSGSESYAGLNTTIKGFTIRNFKGIGLYYYAGTCPNLKNNILENCKGGGVTFWGGAPLIKDNIFQSNNGFGIECSNTNATIEANIFKDNTGVAGGGLDIRNSNARIINNVFTENNSRELGGGIYTDEDSSLILNNTFVNNYSRRGNSIFSNESELTLIDNIFYSANDNINPATDKVLESWREGKTSASYIYRSGVMIGVNLYTGFINLAKPDSFTVEVYNMPDTTIFVERYERFSLHILVGFSGGISYNYTLTSSVYNESEALELKSYFMGYNATVVSRTLTSKGIDALPGGLVANNCNNLTIKNCDFFRNTQGDYIKVDNDTTNIDLTGVDGNISADPMLDDHFIPLQGSPCIDAGIADSTGLRLAEMDFLGNPRIFDGDDDGNAIIDMGAIEMQSSTIQTEEYKSICQGEEYEGHTESGEFQRTLTSATGTDSIVTTYLTVNPNFEIEEYVSICEGEEYLGLTEAGDHQRNFETVNDCDSIIITHLTVNATFSSEESVSICEGDNYLGLTEVGDHERAFESVYGCDSIVVTHLSFYPPFKPTFQIDEDTLTSLQVYSGYQWFDENGIIEGATDQKYIIGKSGDYYLKAQNENGCFYNSDTIFVRYSYAWDISLDGFTYSVMPNPNDGNFSFRIDLNPPAQLTLKLLNTLGQEIETRQLKFPEINQTEQFNVSHLSKGIYQLIIYTDSYKVNRKIVVD